MIQFSALQQGEDVMYCKSKGVLHGLRVNLVKNLTYFQNLEHQRHFCSGGVLKTLFTKTLKDEGKGKTHKIRKGDL